MAGIVGYVFYTGHDFVMETAALNYPDFLMVGKREESVKEQRP